MTIERVAVKFYASAATANLTTYIPVFHRWIQQDTVSGVPLDVADYRHVPNGPGVILIGHDADWGMDEHEGPLGLIYNHKRQLALHGDDEQRLVYVLRQLIHAAQTLQAEASLGLSFDTSRLRIVFNDRLNQENSEAGFATVSAAIEGALQTVFGEGVQTLIERDTTDPRWRLTVHVGLSPAPQLADLAALTR